MNKRELTWDDASLSFSSAGSSKRFSHVDELMKKSAIKPGFHTLEKLPESLRVVRKKEKPKPVKLTPELARDLKVLRMRSVLDNKRFYKRSSLKTLPTDVQIGKVIDSPVDFFSSRLTKKQRKRTLLDELLADSELKKDVKKRYVKIIESNKRRFQKHHKKLVKEGKIVEEKPHKKNKK